MVQHAVRDRRRNITPTGWNDFIEVLHEHNFPKSMLNRETLDELARYSSSMHIVRPSRSRKRERVIGRSPSVPIPIHRPFKRKKRDPSPSPTIRRKRQRSPPIVVFGSRTPSKRHVKKSTRYRSAEFLRKF